jgi:hypothetical protein
MHELVVNKTKDLVQAIRFIFFCVMKLHDHGLIVLGFHQCICGGKLVENSFVVILAMNVDGTTSNNTKKILVDVIILYGGLT